MTGSRWESISKVRRALIDHVNNLKLQYLVELSKLSDSCAGLETEVERWLHEHDVVFKGATIPFVLIAALRLPRPGAPRRHAVTALCRVLDRFCDAYPTDARLREELRLPDIEDQLIRIDPGFPRPMRICRLDAFLRATTSSSSSSTPTRPPASATRTSSTRACSTTIDLPRMRQEWTGLTRDPARADPHPARRLCARPGQPPRAARAPAAGARRRRRLARASPSSASSAPPPRRPASRATHATLDEVTYDGTTLRVKDEPTHLVYRRALLEDLDQSDLVAAARDGRICLVNPFRSRVANNKKLFALFQDPRFTYLVESHEEADVIRATIPWTRILRPGPVTYGDWTIDLLSFVADNRERLVLKPASDFGGHGVSLGMETEHDEWERIISEHADRADYIVQEYVPVPEEMFPTVEDGHVQMRLKRFNVNPFGIGGRYAGSITRISDQAVINVSAGGGLLPSVIGRHKRRLLAEDDDESEVLDGQKP